ncbi:MAG: hypothetical protein JW932_02880 [Deltaproteobacteria bacterium]|nr:hypothetical protein [Deltaproteobacteria bacterium]
MKSVNKIQILIGMAALSIGLMVYLCNRPPDSALILQVIGITATFREAANLFGPINGQLPAFIHVFAFALLTTGLFGYRNRGAILVCLFWLGVNALFEFGQVMDHPFVGNHFEAFKTIFDTGVLGDYFRYGTFDPLDLLAMTLGAVAAFFILQITKQRRVLS